MYKFNEKEIKEARKRLDKTSRGSDEEYYSNLLKEFEEWGMITHKMCSEVMTGDLILNNKYVEGSVGRDDEDE